MPRLWAVYSGKESQPEIDALKISLNRTHSAELKSFSSIQTVDGEVISSDRDSVESHKEHLPFGEEIHILTNEIISTNFVFAYVTPGFISSRYCCIELACLLMRSKSTYPHFFLGCGEGLNLTDHATITALASNMERHYNADCEKIDHDYAQLEKKPNGMSFQDWLQQLLRAHLDIKYFVKGNGSTLPDAVVSYLGIHSQYFKVPPVSDAYIDWINVEENSKLKMFLDEQMSVNNGSTSVHHDHLCSGVFSLNGFDESIANKLIDSLASYRELQNNKRDLNLLSRQLEIIAGFFALPFVDAKWVASMTRAIDSYRLVRLPMPSDTNEIGSTGAVYSALAVCLVNGKIPVLRLEYLTDTSVGSIKARGGIKLSEMPELPKIGITKDDEIRDEIVSNMMFRLYKELSHIPIDGGARDLTKQEIMVMHGWLISKFQKARFAQYIEFDEGTYSNYVGWRVVIDKLHARLNIDSSAKINLPLIVTKIEQSESLRFGPGHTVRLGKLMEILRMLESTRI